MISAFITLAAASFALSAPTESPVTCKASLQSGSQVLKVTPFMGGHFNYSGLNGFEEIIGYTSDKHSKQIDFTFGQSNNNCTGYGACLPTAQWGASGKDDTQVIITPGNSEVVLGTDDFSFVGSWENDEKKIYDLDADEVKYTWKKESEDEFSVEIKLKEYITYYRTLHGLCVLPR